MRLMRSLLATFAGIGLTVLASSAPSAAQFTSGSRMAHFSETFGVTTGQRDAPYSVHLINSSIPGNVLWPGDQPTFTFQVVNETGQALQTTGKVDVIQYGTRGEPGEIWIPHVYKIADVPSVPVTVNIDAHGFANISVSPQLPATLGAYALVLDLGSAGRYFATTCVRTFEESDVRIQYPHFCLDHMSLDVLRRLGVHAIRFGIPYKPTTDPDFDSYMAQLDTELKGYAKNNIAVLIMVGGGARTGPTQPLGEVRPWLDENGVMLSTKFDMSWLPSYDDDFKKWTYLLASRYGWPKGPVDAFSLWNEPWEGISISGWGADTPRYREIYTQMANGVDQARADAGVEVLTGGCDSTSNALDKLFGDGKDTFASTFDFVSLHYQGLDSHANDKTWANRKGYGGRVKIWDTESWVANTDDRVAAVVAGDRAAGYDRAMGVYGGNISDMPVYKMRTPEGTLKSVEVPEAWSTAAAVGASTHFIGERSFRQILFMNGLPWVMQFDGLPDTAGHANPDDGTLVVVGDLGAVFEANALPFRLVRGYAEIKHKAELRAQLAALPANTPAADRAALEKQIDTPETLSGATMTLATVGDAFSLYDFYGNPVPAQGGKLIVPLDGRGFFLRASGAPGSFNKLVNAVKSADVQGIEPLSIVAHDLTAPIAQHPNLRLTITNVLNRPVSGTLSVTLGDLKLKAPTTLHINANETREISVAVAGGAETPNNTYPLSVTFDGGGDGVVSHSEDMHVNWIAHRTITVDGDLSDWKGVPAQTIVGAGSTARTMTEAAWFPFEKFSSSVVGGFATGYLAYDDKNFYFAAKAADDTPDPGTVRFEDRDDDVYFYPDESYDPHLKKVGQKKGRVIAASSTDASAMQTPTANNNTALIWPTGVRHYSYRKMYEIPAGNKPNHDTFQIAFNVLPPDAKPWYPTVPGTMPGFVNYKDTDYEYALDPVAPQYGGGTEIWRLQTIGMPHKHFFPREPKSPYDGPVTNGKLIMKRDGNTRIVECAIPWTEIPEVKKRLDAGQTIKFSFRVNDNAGPSTMELSRGRSVANRNPSFHVDWVEHWANELEFGFEK